MALENDLMIPEVTTLKRFGYTMGVLFIVSGISLIPITLYWETPLLCLCFGSLLVFIALMYPYQLMLAYQITLMTGLAAGILINVFFIGLYFCVVSLPGRFIRMIRHKLVLYHFSFRIPKLLGLK